MALTQVQHKRGTGTSTAPSITLTSAPTQGNLLVAAISASGSAATISISGWTEIPTDSPQGGSAAYFGYFYKIAGAGESATVTGSISASKAYEMIVAEYNDSANGTWTLDQHTHATGTSTTGDTGTTGTTTKPTEVWIGFIVNGTSKSQSSPTNSFTLIDGASTAPALYGYEKFVTSTGTANVSVTLSGSAAWAGIMATFYALGGTAYTATYTGTITPIGALRNKTTKPLAGGITPAGSLRKMVGKKLTGGITPAGALRKLAKKLFSGGITPTGALTIHRVKLLALSGAITPMGTLVRKTTKRVGGSITPAGTLAKHIARKFTGALTPSGVLVKLVKKFPSGHITPTGALSRRIAYAKRLAGSITPVGTLRKRTTKRLSGAITPVGNLAKRIAKKFSGAIAPAGTLTRTQTRPNFFVIITQAPALVVTITQTLLTPIITAAQSLGSVVFQRPTESADITQTDDPSTDITS